MSYSSEVLADSPLLYWKLDETSGTTAADASGNGRAGTHNGPTVNQASLLADGSGKSASYDGTNDWTEIAHASWMNTASLTAECLFTLAATATSRAILFRDNAQGATTNRHWNIRAAGDQLRVGYWDSTVASGTGDRLCGVTLSTNTTYHVALTFDDATKTLRAYVNGVEVPNSPWVYTGAFKGATLQPIEVGRYNNTAGAKGWYHNGRVDEVAVYGTALSSTRIAAHAAAAASGVSPTTVNGGLISESNTLLAGSASVGIVRDGGLVQESTSVLSGAVTVNQVVNGGVVTETTTALAGFATEGIIRYAGLITETTSVLPGVTAAGVLVAGGLVSESTTLFAGSTIDGEQYDGGLVLESSTVLPGSVVYGYATTIRDVTTGRIRYGVGYATWEPAVEPVPPHLGGGVVGGGGPGGVGAGAQVDKALAFGPVTIVGRQPTFEVAELSQPRQRDRIIVGGKDVTYFRGVETVVDNYTLIQPFGYGTASITFPQIFPGLADVLGEGDLSWFTDRAKVIIQRVKEDGSVVTDYRGKIEVHNATSDSASYGVRGILTGPADWRHRPIPLTRATYDIGFLLAQAARQLGVRVSPRLGPETGIEVNRFGDMSFLEYIQGLIGRGWKRNGQQFTMMPDYDTGVFSIFERDRDTVHGTAYLDKSSVDFDLARDTSAEPNRFFATVVTPSGMRFRNGNYPGMFDGDVPFPGFLSEGDSGEDVLALIQRLRITHYLNAETAPGGYDADVTEAVRRVQKKAGLAVTGNVNQATWNSIFDVDKQGASMKLARIEPVSQTDETRPYNFTPSGAIESRNPAYDPTVDKVDSFTDFGTGFRVEQVGRWTDRQLEEAQTANWVGTLTIQTGAIVAGEHTPGTPIAEILLARDIRPGMNLWLPQFQGGIKVHVTAATWNGGVVTLQVDTRARDAWNAAQVIEGQREARKDPAAAFFRQLNSSNVPKDGITEWSEVGGEIDEWDLVEGWNVRKVPAGQAGTVHRIRYETNPNAETAVAVFGKNVWPNALQRLIGNPLTEEGAAKWAQESVKRQLERDHALLYAAGDNIEPGGYSPGYKGEDGTGIFTGRFEDDASFAYYTDNQDVLFVAVWADRATTIPGGRIVRAALEAGS